MVTVPLGGSGTCWQDPGPVLATYRASLISAHCCSHPLSVSLHIPAQTLLATHTAALLKQNPWNTQHKCSTRNIHCTCFNTMLLDGSFWKCAQRTFRCFSQLHFHWTRCLNHELGFQTQLHQSMRSQVIDRVSNLAERGLPLRALHGPLHILHCQCHSTTLAPYMTGQSIGLGAKINTII